MRFIRDIIAEKRKAPLESPTIPSDSLEFDAEEPEQCFEDDFSFASNAAEQAGVELSLDQPEAERADRVSFDEDAFRDDEDEALNLNGYLEPDIEPETASHFEPQPASQVEVPQTRSAVPEDPANEFESAKTLDTANPLANPETAPSVAVTPPEPKAIEVPRPAAGRGAARSGRVKTRILGFGAPAEGVDPFNQQTAPSGTGQTQTPAQYPVGWLAVTDGPGRGAAFPIFDGVSQIGRGDEQAVSLNFGDTSISRENHAAIAFDSEQNSFFVGHGGKTNLVRVNGRPVLSTEALASGDSIRLGETTLRFVGLCGPDFSWNTESDRSHARVL